MASDRPLTVIVVDDQALFRRSVQDRLRSDGYDVVSAENGIEALELLQVAPGPCVVLLDLMMPVMNGVEFLLALDKRGETGDVRVMLVSATAWSTGWRWTASASWPACRSRWR
jgi:CheY-like chemotaxis protein